MPMFQVHDVKEFSASKFVLKIPIQTSQARCRVYCLEPGQGIPLHQHDEATDVFQIVEGIGQVTLQNEVHAAHPDTVILVHPGQPHGITNPGPGRLVFTSIFIPGR